MAVQNLSFIWNLSEDFGVDIFSAIVIVLILVTVIRFYLMSKSSAFKYFIAALSFLFVAHIFKVLTHLTILSTSVQKTHIGHFIYTHTMVKPLNLPLLSSLLAFRIFLLIGFYILYSLYLKKKAKTDIFLIIYLLFLASILSLYENAFFHFTTFLLLTIITATFWKNYKERKIENTKLLSICFAILAASHLTFIFAESHIYVYWGAQIFKLWGYLTLLYTFIKVLKSGKKKG